MLYVDENRCSGCGVCVEVCPAGAVGLSSGVAAIDQERCTQCEACFQACPEQAILSVSDSSIVMERQRPPVVSKSSPTQSRSVVAQASPAVAATLMFIGREVVPRAATFLLNIVDRRLADQAAGGAEKTAQTSGQSRGPGSGARRRKRHRGE